MRARGLPKQSKTQREPPNPREGLEQSFVGKNIAARTCRHLCPFLRSSSSSACLLHWLGAKTLYLGWILGSTESGSRDTKEAHTPTTPCDAA